MYKNRLAKHNGKDDGWVSMPGASDHQTGLGCDVVPSNWKDRGMNDKMMQEPECQWMAEHCQEFGFIIRYPDGKQEYTEINTEPWHLRYVGIPVAAYIMENGLCLEEFTAELQAAIQDFLDRGGDPERVQAYLQTPSEDNP
jgi:D-alanyl-D-alanine carboxypeptidase